MNTDDVIRLRIEAARRKAAADRERREQFQQARTAGKARAHAARLRHHQENAMRTPNRRVLCPACRAERAVQRIAGVTLDGQQHDLVRCLDTDCGLVWAVRTQRIYPRPAAAA